MDLAESLVLGIVLSGPLVSVLAAIPCSVVSYYAWLAALERLASRRGTRGPRALATLSVALAAGALLYHVFLAVASSGVRIGSALVLGLFALSLLIAAFNLAHAWFRCKMIQRAARHPRVAELARIPHAAGRDVELRRAIQSLGLPRWRDVLLRRR